MKRVIAAFIFFTRLPLWRIAHVPGSYFSRVVELWPLTGWLTGGVMALTFYLCSLVFPMMLAAVVALCSRMLLTGALHEDGMADFFDGFGAGGGAERIKAIMKDSHIGTYGVLAIIMYVLLMVTAISTLEEFACFVMLAADPWSKFCASHIINVLPYARTVEQAKNKTVYQRFGIGSFALAITCGAMPLLWLLPHMVLAAVAPVVVAALLIWLMSAKLHGYTGDCCGALFLLCELSFYLAAVVLYRY